MSKLKGLRFCDKCLTAIPDGDLYYADGKKDKCRKCNGKLSIARILLLLLVFGIVFSGGYTAYTDVDTRVTENRTDITATANYILALEDDLDDAFKNIRNWSTTVEDRLNFLYKNNNEELRLLKSTIKQLREETNSIVDAQNKLKEELGSGKMTDKKVGRAIALLSARAKLAEEKLQVVLRNPQAIIDKMIKPTVGIAVRDKKGDHLRGSGVLFRKEEIIVDGKKMYRYYGFTAYHVWRDVFKYLEDIKKPDPSPILLSNGGLFFPPKLDKKMNPRLLIKYYGGNSRQATLLVTNASFVFPNKLLDSIKPQHDIIVFTFTNVRDDLSVAELASDKEINDNIFYGSRVYTTGIAITGTPSLYLGTTANPHQPGDSGIGFQLFGYFGQSGGPIFDAKTLKIISITQRIRVHNGHSPLTNVTFGTLLSHIRKSWKFRAPAEYKNIFDR